MNAHRLPPPHDVEAAHALLQELREVLWSGDAPSACAQLTALTEHEDEEVRMEALTLLGAAGAVQPALGPALTAGLADRRPWVAGKVLSGFGDATKLRFAAEIRDALLQATDAEQVGNLFGWAWLLDDASTPAARAYHAALTQVATVLIPRHGHPVQAEILAAVDISDASPNSLAIMIAIRDANAPDATAQER